MRELGETFGTSRADLRIDSEFSIYSTSAGPGRTEPAGPLQPLQVGRGRTFGVKDGLANGVVLSMLQDRGGLLWLGTQGGVARQIPPAKPEA